MFKYVFTAIACLALAIPTAAPAQDCGCCEPAPAPCVKTRKRLKLVDVQKQVCRTKAVCTTDQCGCSKRKLVRQSQFVTRKQLTVVEEPVSSCGCQRGPGPWKKFVGALDRVKCKMGINPAKHCANGGCNSAPAMYAAPAASCGCASAAPAYTAPSAPCCGDGAMMAVPSVAAPVMGSQPLIEAAPMDASTPMVETPMVEAPMVEAPMVNADSILEVK